MAGMCSDPAELAKYRVHLGRSGEAVSIITPCCGRRTDCDSVVDVRAVANIPHDWLCDGCQHRLAADKRNTWTRSRFARATGAGWREIKGLRVKELLNEKMQTEGRLTPDIDRPVIEASLPNNTRDIPGTEPPGGDPPTRENVAIEAPLQWDRTSR